MSTQIGISTKSQDPVNTKYKIISPLNFKNMSVHNYQNLPTLDPENMSIQNCKNISSKIQIPEPFIDLKHATINTTQLSEGVTFPAGPQVCATKISKSSTQTSIAPRTLGMKEGSRPCQTQSRFADELGQEHVNTNWHFYKSQDPVNTKVQDNFATKFQEHVSTELPEPANTGPREYVNTNLQEHLIENSNPRTFHRLKTCNHQRNATI